MAVEKFDIRPQIALLAFEDVPGDPGELCPVVTEFGLRKVSKRVKNRKGTAHTSSVAYCSAPSTGLADATMLRIRFSAAAN
jgi:hypothetical protein